MLILASSPVTIGKFHALICHDVAFTRGETANVPNPSVSSTQIVTRSLVHKLTLD